MSSAASLSTQTVPARAQVALEAARAHQPVWEILAAVFTALIAHHAVIHGTFHQDDSAILNVSLLIGTQWEALHERPLLYLSMQLNHWLGEKNPFGYHVFNLVGHLLAVAGLYVAVRALQLFTHRVLRRAGCRASALAPGWGATSSYLPFYAALFFAVHPLATEPVAYVMARTNGWGGAFFLWAWALGILAILPERESSGGGARPRKILLGLGALLCLACSYGFKETHALVLAALFPLSLWLAVPAAARPSRGGTAAARRPSPFGAGAWLLGLAVLVLGVLLTWLSRGLLERVWLLFGADPLTMLSSNAVALLWNWGRLLVPYGITLDYDLVFREVDEPAVWAALAGHAVLLALAWYAGRRRPWLRIAAALAYLNLAPTNSIILRYDLWSDRNAYLSFAAGCVVLAGLFQEAAIRLRAVGPRARPILAGRGWACVALLALWLAALGYLAHRRDSQYADTEGFWVDAVAKAPGHPRPQLQLALIREEFGRPEEARAGFEKTLELCDTEDYFGHAHRFLWRSMAEERLAQMDLASGEVEDARERLEIAYNDSPLDANVLRELCRIYLRLEDGEEVISLLDDAREEGMMPLGVEEEAALRKDGLRLIEKFKDHPKPRGGTFKPLPEPPLKKPDVKM